MFEDVYSQISTDARYQYKRKHYLKKQEKYKQDGLARYYEKCDEINQQKKQDIVECDICGIQIRRDSYNRHTISKRHKTLEQLANP